MQVVKSTADSSTMSLQDYFIGNWDVLVKGTPQGDAVVPMRFEVKDNKLKGTFINEQKVETEMTSVEITKTELNSAFTIAGYDVTLSLTKKDADHSTGSLMNMFVCEGTRTK